MHSVDAQIIIGWFGLRRMLRYGVSLRRQAQD